MNNHVLALALLGDIVCLTIGAAFLLATIRKAIIDCSNRKFTEGMRRYGIEL